jgi:hypothetical protein
MPRLCEQRACSHGSGKKCDVNRGPQNPMPHQITPQRYRNYIQNPMLELEQIL